MQRDELLSYLNQLLQPQLFQDYAPNGLQVAGRKEINTIITGVTACQALLDIAAASAADLVLVHHGYFWKGEDPRIIGIKQQRLKTLLANEINLAAYHLPLDAHGVLGNNIQLAQQLELIVTGRIPMGVEPSLVFHGRLAQSMTGAEFATWLAKVLQREPLYIEGGDHLIKTIAWCTGAAPDYMEAAIAAEVDAYLTGEAYERTTHSAREMGMHFFAAGHHATERYGIKALGEHLAERFNLAVEFIDIDNPV